LRYGRDFEAFSRMGRLVGVAITGMDVPHGTAAACVRCLALLPRLEELALGGIAQRSADAFLNAFRAQATTLEVLEGGHKGWRRAWPRLQRLALDLSAEQVANVHAEAVVRTVAPFPALRELMIGGGGAGEEALPPWLRQGPGPVRQARADRLIRLAAEAGVELSFDWDLERLLLWSSGREAS